MAAATSSSAVEEEKRPDSRLNQSNPPQSASRGTRFVNGAYRMVFRDKRTQDAHHNRLNIRDTSQDASNLYGDRSLHRQQPTTDQDLNDRIEDSDENQYSELPDLETGHIPHAERRERAIRQKI